MAQASPPRMTHKKVRLFSGHKFFFLFLYLLSSLILYPYVREGTFGYFVFRVLGGAGILLTCTRSVCPAPS